MVKRVMSRLISISGLGQYDWEIRVIDDPRAPSLGLHGLVTLMLIYC